MSIKICLDPGHGGKETGAIANGQVEKVLNLEVGLLLRKELQRCGFEVKMTRETDIDLDLNARGTLAKDCKALISIHFNACSPPGSGKGFEAIHSFRDDGAKWLAQCVRDEVVSAIKLYDRGVWTRESSTPGHNYYGVLRAAEPVTGVILEGLFLDNLNDVEKLKQPGFLKQLAIAYAKGICKGYAISYVAEVIENLPSANDANWLKANGYTLSLHKRGETMTFGDFENMMMNKNK